MALPEPQGSDIHRSLHLQHTLQHSQTTKSETRMTKPKIRRIQPDLLQEPWEQLRKKNAITVKSTACR